MNGVAIDLEVICNDHKGMNDELNDKHAIHRGELERFEEEIKEEERNCIPSARHCNFTTATRPRSGKSSREVLTF